MKQRLDARLREAARDHGWEIVLDERTPDDDGNLCMEFRRGRERIMLTVWLDPLRPRARGRCLGAKDEHSALGGSEGVLHKLRTRKCLFC